MRAATMKSKLNVIWSREQRNFELKGKGSQEVAVT